MTFKQVLTKDGVPLEITIGGKCRLELKEDTDKRPESRYADAESSSGVIGEGSRFEVYRATILKAVYKTGNSGWQSSYPLRAGDALRDAVAEFMLDEIMGMSGTGEPGAADKRVVQQIVDKVQESIGQRDLSRGVIFGGIFVIDITVPEKTLEAMQARWAAPIKTSVQIREAEANREAAIVESKGKADSIREIQAARLTTSRSWLEVVEALRRALPEMDNELVAYEFVRLVRDLLIEDSEDQEQALGRLIAIRRAMDDRKRLDTLSSFGYARSPFSPPMIQGDTESAQDSGPGEPGTE
jgi:hypothetical protein